MTVPVCPSLPRAFARVFVSTALAVAVVPGWAAEPASAPPAGTSQVVDRRNGEEDKIEKRREWFMSSRRQGVSSPEETARLRRDAAARVRAELRDQRERRADGIETEENFWTSVGPAASHFGGWAFGDVSGRITGIARDSLGAIYIASAAGGVWKTTDDGLSWTNVFENAGTQPTGAVAPDPNDPQVLWVGTGDFVSGCEGYFGIGLLRSADGGATWAPRNGSGASTLDDLSAFGSVVVDPRDSNHVVVGGTIRGCSSGTQLNGGLYTSNDAGATWTKRIADTVIHHVVQDETNRDVWWAATGQGVYKSTNNAVNWVKQTASGLPSSNTGRTEIAVAPSNGNYVYVLYESQGFWRTTNGGGSWTRMSTGGDACDGQCWYNMTLGVHRTNPDVVYRGTILLFKSTNGGSTWSSLVAGWGGSQQVHQDMQALLVDPSAPNKFYIGSDGGMWRSSDGGATFQNMNAGLNLFLFYAVDAQQGNPAVVCGGAQDNSSLARTTSDVWDLQAVTGDGFVCGFNAQEPNYAYITSYPGSYPNVSRSTTGVLGSYSGITGPGSGISSGDRINWVTPYTLDPNDGKILLLGTHRVYRSTNYGSNWTQVGPTDMTVSGGLLNVVEFNRSDSRVAYAGTNDGRVWRSTDNGVEWTDITANLPSGSVNDVAGDPEDPDRALVVMGGFNRPHLYEWTAATGLWTAIGLDLANVPANTVLLKTASEIYVGNDVGVFRSLDRGTTFAPYMNGLPQGVVVTDLKFDRVSNLITAGTYGRGAYQASVAPPGPIVLYDSIVQPLVQVDGDGDDRVEPGETWSVTPILRNAGGLPAQNVTARLVTSTPGVTILAPDVRGYGDLAPGAESALGEGYAFTVSPSFGCGGSIVFDVVDMASSNAPGSYADRLQAFRVTVVDDYGPPVPSLVLDEDFDPNPATGWTHERISVTQIQCIGAPYRDEWRFASKDAAHGSSYHCGTGPGGSYDRYNNAWLYYGGKDSADGPGLVVTPGAMSATLTLVHWYKAQNGADGGQVVVDAVDDNQDTYVPLVPSGGYPGSLASGNCNAQEGRQAFTGNSGGWITSTFDLSKYSGRKIYLAFVFGSDRTTTVDEGWYIDHVKVETQTLGAPACDVTFWAGTVPPSVQFTRRSGGTIEASWAASCNGAPSPGQLYSIQSGDLVSLAASGTYSHAAIGGVCSRTSPATFTPGAAQEYYLVVPNLGGREGGAGTASDGAVRPQPDGTCGIRRVEPCP